MTDAPPLVRVEGLSKTFGATGWFARGGGVRAVSDVDLRIGRGEVVALVGESGSGKTTIGRCVLRLIEPSAGRVTYDGVDFTALAPAALRPWRRRMQYIFQDPYASLSQRMTVAEILTEGLAIQRIGTRAERMDRAAAALDAVEMPRDALQRYPHEFSGGQRQRLGIARALALEPEFVVADEPVSALDVSIQAQIVNLLRDLQQRRGLTMLLISHDLSVVEFLADRIVVLYLGRIMESGPVEKVFATPAHPYTRALLSAIPSAEPGARRTRIVLTGDLPSPVDPPSGCVFRTRCPMAIEACARSVPTLRAVSGDPGHASACLRDDLS